MAGRARSSRPISDPLLEGVPAGSRTRPDASLRVDLHLHTTASDGGLSPADLVVRAAGAGLDVIAITDHDTISGVPEALTAAQGALRVLPAVELSAGFGPHEVHILGYHIDPSNPDMLRHGRMAARYRFDRMAAMLQRLAGLGVVVAMEEVVEEAGGAIARATLGRPHLARVLVRNGHARDFGDAFARLLGDDGPAYVPARSLDASEAIALIHGSGGRAVWAHPPLAMLPELGSLVENGLDGLEVYRPRTRPVEARALLEAAASFELLVSGGSDWHGPWDGTLGSFFVEGPAVAEVLTPPGGSLP